MPEASRSRPSEIYQIVGQNICLARKKRNLSQSQLGKLIGVGQALMASIELGTRRISLEDLIKVSEALGVSVTSLLPEKYKPLLKESD